MDNLENLENLDDLGVVSDLDDRDDLDSLGIWEGEAVGGPPKGTAKQGIVVNPAAIRPLKAATMPAPGLPGEPVRNRGSGL